MDTTGFSPLLLFDSTRNNWIPKEPWLYRSEGELVTRKAPQLRHHPVPYIFPMAKNESRADEPLVQPMYRGFPAEAVLAAISTTTSTESRSLWTDRSIRVNARIWVPLQCHVDMMTGFLYDGLREIETYRSLDDTPILAMEGSIMPLNGSNVASNSDLFEVIVGIERTVELTIIENTQVGQATRTKE